MLLALVLLTLWAPPVLYSYFMLLRHCKQFRLVYLSKVLFLCLTGAQLFALGTEDPKSPRELCNVIHHGYEAQQTYMWAKSSFVLAAYVTSFVLCMLFAIHQRRTFNSGSLRETGGCLIPALPCCLAA